MESPLSTLLIGLLCLALALFVGWPRRGLLAKWRQLRQSSLRVRIEDALKHLYDCEYRKLVCTSQSLAGALSISGDETARLIARLENLGLLQSEGEGFVLTQEGRSYALRIIRVHRLWERYLADETGIDETEWHREAEEAEHRLTVSDAEALSAHMGNPRFDPHGDPIPTASGDLPGQKGEPLNAIAAAETVEIIHIEDEPDVVYAQIVALGLSPGMRIRVIGVTRESIRLVVNGIEHILAPMVAANITVQQLAGGSDPDEPYDTLVSLSPGESGTVLGITKSCRGLQRRRLMDLGVVPGTVIRADMRSAAGDPTAYRIRGASIALRNDQAALVQIRTERTPS